MAVWKYFIFSLNSTSKHWKHYFNAFNVGKIRRNFIGKTITWTFSRTTRCICIYWCESIKSTRYSNKNERCYIRTWCRPQRQEFFFLAWHGSRGLDKSAELGEDTTHQCCRDVGGRFGRCRWGSRASQSIQPLRSNGKWTGVCLCSGSKRRRENCGL